MGLRTGRQRSKYCWVVWWSWWRSVCRCTHLLRLFSKLSRSRMSFKLIDFLSMDSIINSNFCCSLYQSSQNLAATLAAKIDSSSLYCLMSRQTRSRSRKRRPTSFMPLDSSNEDSQEKEQANTTVSSKNRSIDSRKVESLEYLNGSINPSQFRFRQKETQRIQDFLKSCFAMREKPKESKKMFYKFLMLTGSPGAGKTLCMTSLLAKNDYEVIKLNANIVKSAQEVQQLIAVRLLKITAAKAFKLSTVQLIHELGLAAIKSKVIVYIEEIQVLFHDLPTSESEYFLSLFSQKSLPLVLIGISNTINALEKYAHKFSFNVSQIENIVFHPYSNEEVIRIIKLKLAYIHSKTDITIDFDEKLLTFAVNKLAISRKGDLRIFLEFTKETVKEVFLKHEQSHGESQWKVQIDTVTKVLGQLHKSKETLILSLPYQQQVLLIALFTHIKKNDALAVPRKVLAEDLKWVCDSLGLQFSYGMIQDGLPELEQYSMVKVSKKNSPDTRIELCLSLDEIEASFSDHPMFSRFFKQ